MTEFLFIRHAETDLAGTFCGHSDPPLNARGHEQLVSLIASIAGTQVTVVHTSDLKRAHSTAERIAAVFHCPLVVHAGLREIDFGQWEGLAWNEIERRDPVYAQRWVDDFPRLPAPSGELFTDFKARVLHTFLDLAATATGRQAIVTHAGPMRLAITELGGESEQTAWTLTKSYCATYSTQLVG